MIRYIIINPYDFSRTSTDLGDICVSFSTTGYITLKSATCPPQDKANFSNVAQPIMAKCRTNQHLNALVIFMSAGQTKMMHMLNCYYTLKKNLCH